MHVCLCVQSSVIAAYISNKGFFRYSLLWCLKFESCLKHMFELVVLMLLFDNSSACQDSYSIVPR